MSEATLDLMWALNLENGKRWGEVAIDHQKIDAKAIASDDPPYMHFITRPRGGSKSTDIAAICLSWLIVEAPPLSNGHVVASNSDQAAIIIDAAAAIIANTPGLEDAITVENEKLIAPNGAWIRILPQKASGSWGLRDARILILDEFCQWDETRGAKKVYSAIRSTVQKVPGCRLIIISSSGEPSHWSYPIYLNALKSKSWRVSEMPGPVPWQKLEDIEALRHDLLPSEFDRLVLNKWSESEDRAISPEDYLRAAQDCFPKGLAPAGIKGGGRRYRNPVSGINYLITADLGIKNDATAIAVAHVEPIDPLKPILKRLVIDHIDRWAGSKKSHVQVAKVKDRLIELSKEYNSAYVHADPSQFVGTIQELNMSGVNTKEWQFNSSSVGQLATSLVKAFHNGQIYIPDYPELREELISVKLRESTPGVTRLFHDSDKHDDQAVVIGMAAHLFLGQNTWGEGAAWMAALRQEIQNNDPSNGQNAQNQQQKMRSLVSNNTFAGSYGCVKPIYSRETLTCLHCGASKDMHKVG